MKTGPGLARAVLAASAVLIGCGDSSPQTGIVAEITSDLAVPGELDAVEVIVTNAAGASVFDQPFSLSAGSGYKLPLRVGFQPQGSGTAPIRIQAIGRLGATTVVSRSATLPFVNGRVLLLPLPLLAACAGVTCSQAAETCRDSGTCGSDTVDPASLPTYHPGSGGAAGTGSVGRGGTGGGVAGGGGAGRGGTGGGGTGGSVAGNGGAGGRGGTGGSSGIGGAGGRGGTGGSSGGGSGRGGAGGGSGGTSGRGGTGGNTGGASGTGGATDGGTDGPVVVPTLNNGLVGYWAFDQSGTSYPDYSGNGNNASTAAGLWTAAGEVGGALDLTSATFFAVGTPGSASTNTVTTSISIAAWIVPLPPGAVYTIMSRPINIGYWKLGLTNIGVLSFSAGARTLAATGVPGDGTKWVHVAATYDGTTARLYVGGAQVGTATFAAISLNGGPADGGAGGLGVTIGGTWDGTNAFDVEVYNGQIDEVTLYNRALTAAEVDGMARGALPTRR